MRRGLFLTTVLLHAAILLAWAGSLERARSAGSLVRLDVALQDPRDLLRGDFIVLRYTISSVPASEIGGGRGAQVWVLLERRREAWAAGRAPPARALPQPAA